MKEGTQIKELLSLANRKNDYVEEDIINRTEDIIERFMQYISENGLVQQ